MIKIKNIDHNIIKWIIKIKIQNKILNKNSNMKLEMIKMIKKI